MKNLMRGMKIFNLIEMYCIGFLRQEMWQIPDKKYDLKLCKSKFQKNFIHFFSKIFTKTTLKDFFFRKYFLL
jgi:hypothetical protein